MQRCRHLDRSATMTARCGHRRLRASKRKAGGRQKLITSCCSAQSSAAHAWANVEACGHDAEVEKHTNTAQSLPCRGPLLLQFLRLRRGKILAQSCGSVFEMGVCGACGHPGCFNGRSLAVEAAGLRLTHPRPQSTARLLADGLTYGRSRIRCIMGPWLVPARSVRCKTPDGHRKRHALERCTH